MHWQVVILGNSVAATIGLIATAISHPFSASNFDMTLSHRPKVDISEILNGSRLATWPSKRPRVG